MLKCNGFSALCLAPCALCLTPSIEVAMSKYMQIEIRVMPIYERKFKKEFPLITDLFERMGYIELAEKEISFYDLVDWMVTIRNSPNLPAEIKRVIDPYVDRMLEIKNAAREHLLGRRLNELDRLLYQVEDQFKDLEQAL